MTVENKKLTFTLSTIVVILVSIVGGVYGYAQKETITDNRIEIIEKKQAEIEKYFDEERNQNKRFEDKLDESSKNIASLTSSFNQIQIAQNEILVRIRKL